MCMGKFRKQLCNDLGAVWDCYIFPVDLENKVKMLGKSTIKIFGEEEKIVITILRFKACLLTAFYIMYALHIKLLRRI